MANEPVQARPATLAYRTRKFVRRHRAGVAAGVAVLTIIGLVAGAGAAERAGRRRQVADLVGQARRAPAGQRVALYERALGVAPEDATVQALLDKARLEVEQQDARRRLDDAKRLAEERESALVARQELEQERALAAEAREKARVEGEARARAEASDRARALLARSAASQDPLEAIGLANDALALARGGDPTVAAAVGRRKVELGLGLARAALAGSQAGLADYWLTEARKVPEAAERGVDIDAVQAAIAALQGGQRLVEQARGLANDGRWAPRS